MAGISEDHPMDEINKEEIGTRWVEDFWQRYRFRLESLILKLKQSTYCLKTKDWETLIQDEETPDSPFIGSISMRYQGDQQKAYVHYNDDLLLTLSSSLASHCRHKVLSIKKLKEGHLINNELFRLEFGIVWDKGSLVPRGMSDEQVKVGVKLCIQYLGMPLKS